MITLNCLHHASHLGPLLSIFVLFSSYIFTCQLVVRVLLTLASYIGDTRFLTILAYIKDYNPKLLVIIIIIIIVIIIIIDHMLFTNHHYQTGSYYECLQLVDSCFTVDHDILCILQISDAM